MGVHIPRLQTDPRQILGSFRQGESDFVPDGFPWVLLHFFYRRLGSKSRCLTRSLPLPRSVTGTRTISSAPSLPETFSSPAPMTDLSRLGALILSWCSPGGPTNMWFTI